MHVVIFEGVHWQTFAPLALSRPVFMLATGMSTLLDKQIRHTSPTRLTLWVRPEMAELAKQRIAPKLGVPTAVNEPLDDAPALLLSGRTLYVVQNRVNTVAVLKLNRDATSATVETTVTDPRFDVPTTVASFGHRLYLPNARFTTTPTPTTPYTAVAVPKP